MSYLIPNNQLQQSGLVPVVFASGGMSNVVHGNFGNSGAVPIQAFGTSGLASGVQTFGLVVGIASSGRRMVDVNRYGFDDGNENDQRLLTKSALEAYNDEDFVTSRLRALKVSSGVTSTLIPTSGFALFTASTIIDTKGRMADNLNVNSGSNTTNIPTSGIALRTVSAIMGPEGGIADVFDDSDPFLTLGDVLLHTADRLYGFAGQSGVWIKARVTESGKGMSGIPHRLAVALSGDNVFEHGSALITNPMTQVPSLSGGVVLSSGSVFSVTINSLSGNNPVWVGGTGSQAPFSGKGAIVYGGGSLSLKIDSVDDIRVFAEVSGQHVSWIGVQK